MFLEWKNQHCKNDSTTQSNLQIQCNPYKNSKGISHKNRKINPKIHTGPQIAKATVKKNKSGVITPPIFKIQSYSNQNSTILA